MSEIIDEVKELDENDLEDVIEILNREFPFLTDAAFDISENAGRRAAGPSGKFSAERLKQVCGI